MKKFHYGTVSEAINKFRQQGFTIDFNLEENCFTCEGNTNKYNTEDFEIVDVYRYEGDSDPGDEAVVYAIQSNSGLKGILVAGYGASSDPGISNMLEKLHYKNTDG